MYSVIKKIFLSIVPKRFLFSHEKRIRSLYALMYAGNRFQCNICHYHLKAFIHPNSELLCPACGSIPRDRKLWQLLQNEFLAGMQHVLDFSPSRSIYREMKKRALTYISTDLSGDFISDQMYDITDITVQDESFDLIICYHILEHIDDDIKAMKELIRVLKSNGICLVQTPFKEGEIYEDETIISPEQRVVHFGQSDHVRIYSVEGLKIRLQSVGFEVEVRNFVALPENIHGFKESETIFICRKNIQNAFNNNLMQ